MKKDAALERVEELEEAITVEEPDLPTMEYVKSKKCSRRTNIQRERIGS